MQIILEEVQSIMAKSELPIKYWANVVYTVVYIQNLIPSTR